MAKLTKEALNNLIRKAELLRGFPIPTFVDALSVEEWLDAGGGMLLGFPNEELYLAHQEIWQNVPDILDALGMAWQALYDVQQFGPSWSGPGAIEAFTKAESLLEQVGLLEPEVWPRLDEEQCD